MSDKDRQARNEARAHAHHLPPAHDRDAINAAAQRHPAKPFQGSATRADDGTPMSTTEHPAHASLLDPETSGQAAGTLALPGDTEPLPARNAPTDAVASSPVSNPGDPEAPPSPVRDEPNKAVPTGSSGEAGVTQNSGSPPPAGSSSSGVSGSTASS